MTTYSRQEVLRILQISAQQMQGWIQAGLIAAKADYNFQDLSQLRTVRALRAESVSATAIRNSVNAMRLVAGMAYPLTESRPVRSGKCLAFRHSGALMDPISRQLIFDFEGGEPMRTMPTPLRRPGQAGQFGVQDRFLEAVQAEEAGEKQRAIELYHEILRLDPLYAPAYINMGTIHFHLRQFELAEEFYRRATMADPGYVLAFFDLGNVLDELGRSDESIAAYRQAIALAPRYADAHYNLALAYERQGLRRPALRHWEAYVKLDANGPWAEHARSQIRKLLSREKLAVAWRAERFVAPCKGMAGLAIVGR